MSDKIQITQSQDNGKGKISNLVYLLAFIALSIAIYRPVILPTFKSINNIIYHTCINNARENSYKCEEMCFVKLSECLQGISRPGGILKNECSAFYDKRCYSRCNRVKDERIISCKDRYNTKYN